MEFEKIDADCLERISRQKRKALRERFVRIMACVVVFCTTYALIIPALTLERETLCGIEEHTHNESCYELQSTYICGLEESEGHTHTDACFTEEDCLSCGMAEVIPHTHDAGCYDGNGDLICEKPEVILHTHSEECLDEEGNLVCGMEELKAHTHTAACMTTTKVLTCQIKEQEAHTHTEECVKTEAVLVCATEEHSHSEPCYPTETEPTEVTETSEPVETTTATEVTETTGTESTAAAQEATEATEPDAQAETESTEETVETVEIASLLTRSFAMQGQVTPTSLTNVSLSVGYTAAAAADDVEYDPDTDTFDVAMHIGFKLTKEEIINAQYLYTYELPDSLIVPDNLFGKTYIGKDTAKTDAFTFSFEKYTDDDGNTQYRVNIHFLEDYVDKAGDTIDAYIEFHGKARGDAVDKETGNLVIDEDLIIEKDDLVYPEDETHYYSIQTEKTASDYNSGSHTIDYTVKVSSTKGTPDPIHIEDVLTASGISINRIQNVTVKNAAGETVTPSNLSTADNTITMDLPALAAGEEYEITYSCECWMNGGPGYNNQEGTVSNTVTASTENPDLKSSASTKTEINNDTLSKSGSYDAENQEIIWTIKVKPGPWGLDGYKLTDPAFNTMTDDELRAAISPDTGFEISTDSSGNKQIVFSSISEGQWGGNHNTYTITYSTKAPVQTTKEQTEPNTVTLTPERGQSTNVEAEVTIPAGGSVSKSFVSAADKVLTWSITVDIPEGGLAEGTTITDTPQNIMVLTYDQITEIKNQLDSLLGSDGYSIVVDGTVFGDGINADATFSGFQIIVNKDFPQSSFADGKLTLTYSTEANEELQEGWNYSNTVQMGDKSDTETYTYKNHVLKMDGDKHEETTTPTTKDGTVSWLVRVYVENDSDKVTVVDTLPAGVTLTKLGYGNEDWNAKNNAKEMAASDSVSIMYQECTVTNTSQKVGESQQITTVIQAQEGSTILAGSTIYLYYVCSIDDITAESPLTLVNSVEVWVNDVYYGSDDQQQDVELDLPPQIQKTNQDGKTETTELESQDGIVRWFVEVFLYEEAESFTVKDLLPEGLKLVKFGLSDNRSWYGVALNDNKLNTTQTVGDVTYSVSTEYVPASDGEAQYVTTTISAPQDGKIPARKTLYLYYECQMDQLPAPGETVIETYTNTAILNPDSENPPESSQTQEVTVEIPNLVSKLGVDANGNKTTDDVELTFDLSNTTPIVKWLVRTQLTADANQVVVTDTLPVGVKLSKLGLSYNTDGNSWNAENDLAVSIGESTSGTVSFYNSNPTGAYVITGTGVEGDPYVVTTTIYMPSGSSLEKDNIICLYYECEIDPLPELGEEQTYTLVNNAEVKVDGTIYGSPSQKQEVTVKNPAKRVQKGMVSTDVSNRISYEVLLNEAGEDFVEDGQYVEVVDTMSFYYSPWHQEHKISSSLVMTSVQLYPAIKQDDGTFIKGTEPIEDWSWEFTSNQNEVHATGWGDVYNVIKAQIPDETPVYLVYSYDITPLEVPEDQDYLNPTISNTAKLTGVQDGEASTSDGYKVELAGASGGASTDNSYVFTKVEQGNFGHLISGAVFTVYKSEDQSYVTEYTTSSNGKFTIEFDDGKTDEASTGYYAKDVLYYVTETGVPAGYLKPADPPKYYFYFSSGDNAVTIPEGITAYDLSAGSVTQYVPNEKIPTTQIEVVKKWYQADGTTLIENHDSNESITVDLYQVASSTEPEQTASGVVSAENWTEPAGGVKIKEGTINIGSSWKTTFSDLLLMGMNDGNVVYYSYYVVEQSGTNFELVSYENNAGITDGTITISNKVTETPVFELPATGGSGRELYTAAGAALMAAAAWMLWLLKKRKKGTAF